MPSPNPELPALHHDIAQVLSRGYTLVTAELQDILPYYGYASDPGTSIKLMGSEALQNTLADHGVELETDEYKRRKIWFDGSLPPEETDIDETLDKIAKEVRATALRRYEN